MLTLQEVEHGIKHYATVDLGGELAFPIGMSRDEAAEHLLSIASQVGGFVERKSPLGAEQLIVFPPYEAGYWKLTWRGSQLEVARFAPETRSFARQS